MNAHPDQTDPLDEVLARSYAPLRETVPGQREAILAGVAQPQSVVRSPWWHSLRRPPAWLATAACLAGVAIAVALLIPSPAHPVYGVEAIPRKLAEVQTIRQRGYEIIYPRKAEHGEPVRVPVENFVKRPDKFRHTWRSVSYPNDAPMIVRTGYTVCDGQRESSAQEADKIGSSAPVSLLDAWIKTETRAELFLNMLLGPPEVAYKKTGSETVGGRPCDIYEGRYGDDIFLSRLWVDPATGYPVRSTLDQIMDDGTMRRVQELEEIAVNVPLDDKLFEFAPSEDFRITTTPGTVEPMKLNPHCTTGGFGFTDKLEAWHAFRITANTALVVWRRSAPPEADDGTMDWLEGVKFSIRGKTPEPRAVHDWVYQSRSPDVWNWSLVAVADGPLPDRGSVLINLDTEKLDATTDLFPLRFPEAGLKRIIEAAAASTLPENGPQFKLEHLRTLAEQLMERQASQ